MNVKQPALVYTLSDTESKSDLDWGSTAQCPKIDIYSFIDIFITKRFLRSIVRLHN